MIIPSIDLMSGNAVQLVQGKVKVIDAGDPKPLATRFGRVGEVAVIDLDAAMGKGSNQEVIEALLPLAPCRVGGGIRDVCAARAWLNKGARKIIIGTAATPEFLKQLPKERLIVALDAYDDQVMVEGWQTKTGKNLYSEIARLQDYTSEFLITFIENEGKMSGIDLARVKRVIDAANPCKVTVAGGTNNAQLIADIDTLGADTQVGMALYTNQLDLGDALWRTLKSDRPDQLVPTLVVDELGVALGLAYSSRASLVESINTGKATYQSRKRGLWSKGESSGNTQELMKVSRDCDNDTIKFVVRQKGPGFCHNQTQTCFGDESGLLALERQIANRQTNASEGSYTQRLLSDPKMLDGKILEEARELSEANGKADVTHEAADLFYFTLVKCAKAGVTLGDISQELARRRLVIERRAGEVKIAPSVADIIRDVELGGKAALVRQSIRLEDLQAGDALIYERPALKQAFDSLCRNEQDLLMRVAERIRSFALAQRDCLGELNTPVPGGRAGHTLAPVASAGCYAPGGRYPLPSSVLMTALVAKAAGVDRVIVASPKPAPITLAAAYVAGADRLLAAGGAQAIAAMAFGVEGIEACDLVVGPGNRYVTEAKRLLNGVVGIDMLAGPSELVIVADASANPKWIAADLLAQAEHDVEASAILIALNDTIVERVQDEIEAQLNVLPSQDTARQALLNNSFALLARDLENAAVLCNQLAPEHLQLMLAGDINAASERFTQYGALFLGDMSAEVFGDYGFGPNHTLPTGRSARFTGGLSVATFLRQRTWLRIDDGFGAEPAMQDAMELANLEGLSGHARAAQMRISC